MAVDERAKKILMARFWSPAGWKLDPVVPPEDFAYAKIAGLMFDPLASTHDQTVASAVAAVSKTNHIDAVNAFISSLGSRRLELRSALGSYAVGRHLKQHGIAMAGGRGPCPYCGEYGTSDVDLNVLNFERFKWGGVRHEQPEYIAFDLKSFATLERVKPTKADFSILRAIFESIRCLPPTSRLRDLERALSGILPSNKSERQVLISILGYAGVLVDLSRPDFRGDFVPFAKREHTRWSKDDWPYPVRWWTGSCGLNQAAIDEWFPDL